MISILSGPSGAGKSTWCIEQSRRIDGVVVSADHLMMPKLFQDLDITIYKGVQLRDYQRLRENGSFYYEFDPEMLSDAHPGCFRAYINAMMTGQEHIIVDNTSVNAWEKSPYVLAAQAYGRDYEIVRFETPLDRCIEQSKVEDKEIVRKHYHVHHNRNESGNRINHMPWWSEVQA